jgi:hypothetical protein
MLDHLTLDNLNAQLDNATALQRTLSNQAQPKLIELAHNASFSNLRHTIQLGSNSKLASLNTQQISLFDFRFS